MTTLDRADGAELLALADELTPGTVLTIRQTDAIRKALRAAASPKPQPATVTENDILLILDEHWPDSHRDVARALHSSFTITRKDDGR